MNIKNFFLAVMTVASSAAFAETVIPTQSKNELQAEAVKLEKALQNRAMICAPKLGGDKLWFNVSVQKGALKVTGEITGMQPIDKVQQLTAGDTIMLQVTGADSDEGEAILLVSAFYLLDKSVATSRDDFVDADVLLYSETGPGDNSATLHKVQCKIK